MINNIAATPSFLNPDSEAGKLILAGDWSDTTLGDVESWPQSLKTSLGMILYSPFPVFLLWGNDYLCFYNDAVIALLSDTGRHPAMFGRPAHIAFQDHWEQLKHKINHVVSSRQPVWNSKEVMIPNDKSMQQESFRTCNYTPVFDESGAAGGICITCADATASVHMQQQLESSQSVYNAITGSTPDLIYVFDLDYKFTYANKALLEMWGRTWEDSIGQGLLALGYEPWHAAMHEREIDEVVRTKKSIRGTVSFPHATLGRRIYDYIFAPVFDNDGNVTAIAGTTRDISEIKHAQDALQQSENQFRSLTQSLPQLIWTARADGYCDFFNEQWYAYTGCAPDDAYGNGWAEYIHPAHREELLDQWQESLQTGKPIIFEFQLRSRDGGYNWFHVHGNPIRDEQREIRKWVGALTDIEERKAAEERLERMVRERTSELQRSNSDLQQFAHVASHDLKEPVRKIKTFANLLENDHDTRFSEKAKLYLHKIYNATGRMNSMINGVLNYSTLSNTEESFEQVDLNEILANVETDLELLIQQKNVSIIYHDLPTITGAPVLLHQLFYNLINNSLKFSQPDRAPVIQITAALLYENGAGLVSIQVKDNGIGFPQQDAERIFQTFTRLHAKDRYEGTGLGLALCKKIVDRHRGHIRATGVENEGAVFTITLPVYQNS